MAQVPMQHDSSGVRVLKTATANTTYASQLTELATAFDQLSDADKYKTRFVYGGFRVPCFSTSGVFSGLYEYNSTLRFLQARLSDKTFKTANATFNFTDVSSTTYSGTLILEIVE